jgi:sulfatase modifying factor 1
MKSFWRTVSVVVPSVLMAFNAAPQTVGQCLTSTELGSRVLLPAGSFMMGEAPRYPEEGPPHRVAVEAFEMDAHEVTNAQFARFVADTGYRTSAERAPPALPGAPPDMLLPGSATFNIPSVSDNRWWIWTVGANWRQPEGPGSSIMGKDHHPLVQISFEDALAYARWAGGALPSEAQWEYAARGGGPALAEPVDAQGEHQANTYQGVFPARDLGEDGHTGRAAIGCYKPNGFGLFDMIGNVWEWTATSQGDADGRNIIKGGSYLCAANYCARYRPSAWQFQELDLGTNHIGLRLVYPARGAIADSGRG